MAEVVRIVNTGQVPFTEYFNGSKYSIPPGQQLLVDFDAMALWLGHPHANNFDPRNRVRVQEYQRLRVKYGVEARALELTTIGQPVDSEELFRQMKPSLEVFDAAGNPIVTVADDPEGTLLSPPSPDQAGAPQSDIALIMARLQQMEQETADLRAELARRDRQDQAITDADPIPQDHSGVAPPPATRSDIPGSITSPPTDGTPQTTAPRPPARESTSDDSPTRVRVSGA